ncbi:MAG: SOS response-associated peptidase [Sulfuricella sp.]|nr:SOS response-associated peptidase [Sulfuricella sp.]
MPGRFAITTPRLAKIEATLDTAFPALRPRYNIAPSQNIPAIRASGDGGYRLVFLHWGLIPRWSKEGRTSYSTINARAETIEEKAVYRDAFRHRRCLIPASGFYEWVHAPGSKPQPWYIHLKDQSELAFAGVWEHWEKEGEIIESCSIIVTEPNALVKPIHHRMPVILKPEDYALWLDPAVTDALAIKPLLQSYPADEMEAWKVDQRVNSVKQQGPELVRPLESEANPGAAG